MNGKKLAGELRRQQILDAAVNIAQEVGYTNISRDDIARQARVSESLIQFHFHTMDGLRNEIVQQAIREGRIPVVLQAISLNHRAVSVVPKELHKKIIDHVKSRLSNGIN